jgi:transposase
MDSQPEDIAALRAELALARAELADDAAIIARQNLEIAKLKRQIYGPRSERTARRDGSTISDGAMSGISA